MYRLARILAKFWFGLCVAWFLSGVVISLLGAPSWLPLPWSDFQDFVEGPDGKVYVGLGFYHRVLCYDRDGHFLASYRPPFGKHAYLAADARGHVYCLTSSGRSNLGVYDGAWRLVREYSEPHKANQVWRLGADGVPALHAAPENARAVNGPAEPGDIIFSNWFNRKSFACADGTTLIRRGGHLERQSADGRVIARYAAPVLLWPFTFPWPAVIAWPLGFLPYVLCRRENTGARLVRRRREG